MEFTGSADDFDLGLLFEALLADLPYELYWFNKSADGAISMDWVTEDRRGYLGDDSSDKLYWIELSFIAMDPYREDKDYPYKVDTSETGRASSAIVNAEEIIEKYEDASDYEKIIGYHFALHHAGRGFSFPLCR
jgi:hypothetical protein